MYFELKAFETPREGSSGFKTKIQLNVGPPFSADTKPEISKEKLEPKRVYDLLQFIAADLIPRIVIKHNQARFDTPLKQLAGLRGSQSWEDFFRNATADQLAQFNQIESAMLADAVNLMSSLPVPEITQFNFDELSPGALAVAQMTVINSNVPPPRPSPR